MIKNIIMAPEVKYGTGTVVDVLFIYNWREEKNLMGRLKLSRIVWFVSVILFIGAFLCGCEKKETGNELTSTGQTQQQAYGGSTSLVVPPPRPDDYGADDSNKDATGSASISLKITSQTCQEGFVLNLMQELNDGSKIADWNEMKQEFGNSLPEELDRLGLGNNQAAWITVSKQEFWQGKRHYFIQRFDDGKPSDFLAHDQVGNIYLGSWYNIELPVLITTPEGDKTTLHLTSQAGSEVMAQNLVQNEYGSAGQMADWTVIKQEYGSSLPTELDKLGLKNKGAAWVMVKGKEYWGEKRHYFIQRWDDGKPSDFLAHDQIGDIYLGSWYDLQFPVLVTTR